MTNYALGQLDAYIPVRPPGAPNQVPPSAQENDFTFRPRTFGVTVTWHVGR